MDLKESDILGSEIEKHWYYRSKAKAVLKLLAEQQPSVILDVGAGSGFFSRQLLASSTAKEAWCLDIGYDKDSEAFEAGKPIYYRRSCQTLNADLVLLMDVLEHVDDDVALLKDYVERVPVGSRFLISVPAFQFLWSDHDLFLEHKRRYRADQVEQVANQAGLRVISTSYFFGAVFPLAASLRILNKLSSSSKKRSPKSQLALHSPVVNSLLETICDIELPFLKINQFMGLTVFCLAEKIS